MADLIHSIQNVILRFMKPEQLLIVLSGLARPVSETQRQKVIDHLRSTPADIDGRRDNPWKRRGTYFHALQDLALATMIFDSPHLYSPQDLRHDIEGSQACFVKDLDLYFRGFPPQEAGIRQVFQAVYDTGTSTFWHNERPFTQALNAVCWELDKYVIRPWASLDPE